jgi:hypothetical protein
MSFTWAVVQEKVSSLHSWLYLDSITRRSPLSKDDYFYRQALVRYSAQTREYTLLALVVSSSDFQRSGFHVCWNHEEVNDILQNVEKCAPVRFIWTKKVANDAPLEVFN